MDGGTHNVGSIYGILRLDIADWKAKLEEAKADAEALLRDTAERPLLTGTPDDTKAMKRLEDLQAAENRLANAQDRLATASRRMRDLEAIAAEEQRAVDDAEFTQSPEYIKAQEALARAYRDVGLAELHKANTTARAMQATEDEAKATEDAATASRRAAMDTARLAAEARRAAAEGEASAYQMNRLQKLLTNSGGGDRGNQPWWSLALPALIPLAAGVIPILGVATGAAAGLVATLGTALLAYRGLANASANGALSETSIGDQLSTLHDDLTSLEYTAAGGFLGGLQGGLLGFDSVLHAVSPDVTVMADQIGRIVSGVGPGLVSLFHDLAPLLDTIGTMLDNGAQRLELWAANGQGVSHWVAYIQTELPVVTAFFGNLIGTVGHLVSTFVPLGNESLFLVTEFLRVTNALLGFGPASQYAVNGLLAIFAAWKALQFFGNTNSGLVQWLASLQTSEQRAADKAAQSAASQARSASLAATARAAEARAAVAAAQAEVDASTEVDVAAREEMLQVVAAKEEEAAAAETAAEVAATAAADTAAAAAATADAVDTAGEAASAGWASMLGPVGALAAGVGILTMMFLGNNKAAQQNQEAINSLTDALVQSNDVVTQSIRLQQVKQLQSKGAISLAQQLGISTSLLTEAVTGNSSAWGSIQTTLHGYLTVGQNALTVINNSRAGIGHYTQAQVAAANADITHYTQAQKLGSILNLLSGNFNTASDAARNELNAMQGTSAATRQLMQDVQDLTDAYSALDNNLSSQSALLSFNQAMTALTTSIHQNGHSLLENTAAGQANMQAVIAVTQAAESYRQAIQKQTGSLQDASNEYVTAIGTLLRHIAVMDHDRTSTQLAHDALYQLVLKLSDYNQIKVQTKQVNVDTSQAQAALANLMGSLNAWENAVGGMPVIGGGGAIYTPPGQHPIPGHTGYNATGTPFWRGGLTWVGERGPELVDLPRGSKVFTSRESQMSMLDAIRENFGMLSRGMRSHSGPTHVTIVDADGHLIGTMRTQAMAVQGAQAREFAWTVGR